MNEGQPLRAVQFDLRICGHGTSKRSYNAKLCSPFVKETPVARRRGHLSYCLEVSPIYERMFVHREPRDRDGWFVHEWEVPL